jgi:hypothetical protein
MEHLPPLYEFIAKTSSFHKDCELVLQPERGKREEVGGGRQKIKCQSSNDKVQMERSLGERKNKL